MNFADNTISENKRDWSAWAAINLDVSFTHSLLVSFPDGCMQYFDLGERILEMHRVHLLCFSFVICVVISSTSVLQRIYQQEMEVLLTRDQGDWEQYMKELLEKEVTS